LKTAREALNELRWRGRSRLGNAILWYLDRTRPEGYRLIRGSEIVALERRYFETAETRLPYYKVVRIECEGRVVFERQSYPAKSP